MKGLLMSGLFSPASTDKYNDFIDANRLDTNSERLKTMNKLVSPPPPRRSEVAQSNQLQSVHVCTRVCVCLCVCTCVGALWLDFSVKLSQN